jgi:hypothetical protein
VKLKKDREKKTERRGKHRQKTTTEGRDV